MRLGVPENKVVSAKKAGKKLSNKAAAKVPIVQHTFTSAVHQGPAADRLPSPKRIRREQIILDFQHIDLTGKKKIDKYYTSAIDKILRTYKVGGIDGVLAGVDEFGHSRPCAGHLPAGLGRQPATSW